MKETRKNTAWLETMEDTLLIEQRDGEKVRAGGESESKGRTQGMGRDLVGRWGGLAEEKMGIAH